MADDKKPEIVTLVAVERGFLNGRLVEPGQTFQFRTTGEGGKVRKLPSWAVKEGDPRISKPKPQNDGDLKPKDAQAAAKGKRDGLADDLAG